MQHWVASLGPTVLFLLVLLQQAGVPFPVTPILIVAGAASVRGALPATAVIGLAVAAALLADLGWYVAGARLGARALRALCALSLSPDSCVSDTERWFGRFGTRVLIVAKFIPGLGLVATAMAGVARASLEAFVLYDLAGNVLWVAAAVLSGVLFHDAVGDVLRVLTDLGYWGVALLAAALAGFLAVKLWQRYALLRELRLARITVPELKELVDGGRSPVIIDALAPASRQREGMIPGAIPVETLGLQSGSVTLPLKAEVVVYCACPNEASAARIAKQLIRMGCIRVRPLTGGIFAWKDAGLDVEPVQEAPVPAVSRAAGCVSSSREAT